MITKLTDKQKLEIVKIRDEWLELCQTQKDITIKDVEKGVENIYALDGRKKPLILILDDPLQCQYIANILSTKKGRQIVSKIDSQMDSQIDREIRSQIDSQMYGDIRSQIVIQIDRQIRSQMDSQIDSQIDREIRRQIDSQMDSQIDREIRSQIDSQIDKQIRSQIDRDIRRQIDRDIRSQKLFCFSQLGGLSWRSWYYSYYEYYLKTKLLKIDKELEQNIKQQIEFLKKVFGI